MTRRSNNVVIVGAGPVGMLSAISMLNIGLKPVLLTDRVNLDSGKIFSLNCTSIDFISSLGVEIPECAGSITRIRVSDTYSEFMLREYDSSKLPISYVIPSEIFSQVLFDACKKAGVAIIQDVKIEDITSDTVTYHVTNPDVTNPERESGAAQRCIRDVALVLACDGYRSQIKHKYTDIQSVVKDYNQYSSSYLVRHEDIARNVQGNEVFFPDGSMIASVPIDRESSGVIWTHKHAEPRVNEIFEHLTQVINEPIAVDLISRHKIFGMISDKLYYNNIVMLGSSHCVLHPVAGQGLNLGIKDVFVLSSKLNAAYRNGINISNIHILHDFNIARINNIKRIWFFTNIIGPALSSRLVRIPRKICIMAINNIAYLRRLLVSQAIDKNTFRRNSNNANGN